MDDVESLFSATDGLLSTTIPGPSQVMVIRALIISWLDYCNSLCLGLLLKTVQKVHQGQNAATRVLIGFCAHNHVPLAFKDLSVHH